MFFGTSEFACEILDALVATDFAPTLIVTRTDSISGRRQKQAAPPVKKWAQAHRAPIWQPANVNSGDSIAQLEELDPQLFIVVAYGRILSKTILAVPALGAVNVHASLLPDLRGAAPIEWAILGGRTVTGVTTMFMDEGLDTGDIILQASTPIGPAESGGQLKGRLASIAQKLLLETLPLVFNGVAPRTPQPTGRFQYAPPIDKSMGRLDWNQPARELANKVRALAPKPGAFCFLRGKRLKVNKAIAVEGSLPAGSLKVVGKNIVVGSGSGLLQLEAVQPEGKKVVAAEDFINGYRLSGGEILT